MPKQSHNSWIFKEHKLNNCSEREKERRRKLHFKNEGEEEDWRKTFLKWWNLTFTSTQKSAASWLHNRENCVSFIISLRCCCGSVQCRSLGWKMILVHHDRDITRVLLACCNSRPQCWSLSSSSASYRDDNLTSCSPASSTICQLKQIVISIIIQKLGTHLGWNLCQ